MRYDYQCKKCAHVHEVSHGMAESPRVKCPQCKGGCAKVLIAPTIVSGKTGREIWDYDVVREIKPKWLKSKDGKTRVRYDSSKHGFRKGCQSHLGGTKKPKRKSAPASSESSEEN